MNAPELDVMNQCPELEDLAAFHDGRLSAADRTRVLEHLDACGLCLDIIEGLRDAAGEKLIGANVVQGRFGGRTWLPAAMAAAVAAVVAFVFLGPLRTDGMEELVAASTNLRERPVASRLSADFPYRDHRRLRGPEEKDEHAMMATAAEVADVSKNASAKKLHAAGVAYLHLGIEYRADAVTVLKAADAKRPNDPAILTDLAAAHLAVDDATSALTAVNAALAVERTPAALWNRALALQALERDAEARAAWNEYLAVDPSSEWATEVRSKYLDDTPAPADPPTQP